MSFTSTYCQNAVMQHECTHTHARTYIDSHTHTRAHTLTHTHTHTSVAYQGNKTEEKLFLKRKVFKEDLKELTGRMADRSRELVPDNWSLVRERALTTGLCSEGWYSEDSVCRRAELPGRSVKVKKF